MLFYVHSSWDAKYGADSSDALPLNEGTSSDGNLLPPNTEALFHQRKASCTGRKIDFCHPAKTTFLGLSHFELYEIYV